MSVRYSYDSFSTKGHGVIETSLSSYSDDYVIYEIENDIPVNYRLIARTKDLSEYIKDPNHSIAYGKKKQGLTRINQIKSQLCRDLIIRVDNVVIKRAEDGLFEIYQLLKNIKIATPNNRKASKHLVNRKVKKVESFNEIYNHLLDIQRNSEQKRKH
jgi:hypothetical protein